MAQRRFILTDLDKRTVEHLDALIELAQLKGDGIDMDISGHDGGSSDIGLEITNLLENTRVPITGIVRKNACSMAAIIFQSCATRKMHEAAYLDFHYALARHLLTYFDDELMARNKKSGIVLQEKLFAPAMKRNGMEREGA